MLVAGSIGLAVALGLVAPGGAAAQSAAANEYELGPLPTPENGNPDASAASAGGDDSGGSTPPSSESVPAIPESASSPAPEDSSGASSGGDSGDKGDRGSGSSGGADDSKRDTDTGVSPSDIVPAVQTNASQGGGAPISLIVLGIVAAVCTGFAAWRMHRRDGVSDAGGAS